MPSNLPNILIVDDNTSYLLYLEIILFDVKANIYKADQEAYDALPGCCKYKEN